MASKKRKKKIANKGGYNFLRENVHLLRKKAKVELRQTKNQPKVEEHAIQLPS